MIYNFTGYAPCMSYHLREVNRKSTTLYFTFQDNLFQFLFVLFYSFHITVHLLTVSAPLDVLIRKGVPDIHLIKFFLLLDLTAYTALYHFFSFPRR